MGSASSSMSARPFQRQQENQQPFSSGQNNNSPALLPVHDPDQGIAQSRKMQTAVNGSLPLPHAQQSYLPSPPNRYNIQLPKVSNLQAPEITRNMSVNSAIGVPLSKVEIGEKEEGEISEEEEPTSPQPYAGPSHSSRPAGYPRVQQQRQQRQPIPQSSYPIRVEDPYGRQRHPRSHSPPKSHINAVAGPSRQPVPASQLQSMTSVASRPSPSVSLPSSTGSNENNSNTSEDASSLAAPSDISPEDAQKYMDIIRKLLHGGYSPDLLVKRGATAKYVTAVCEEIVEGTKKRKALWLGPTESLRPSQPTQSPPHTAPPLTPPREDQPPISIAGSPSSEVEVLVSINRRGSMSSEGSAEFELIEKPSPPLPRPPRLVPSSHWAPPVQPPLKPVTVPPTRPIKIESYKPAQPAAGPSSLATPPTASGSFIPSRPPNPGSVPSPIPPGPSSTYHASGPSSLQLPVPVSSYVPSGPSRSPVQPAGLIKTLPTGPKKKQKKSKKGKKSKDEIDIDESGPATLNYDDEPMLLDPPPTGVPAQSSSIAIPPTAKLPPRPSALPVRPIAPSGPTTFPPWFSNTVPDQSMAMQQSMFSSLPSRPPAPQALQQQHPAQARSQAQTDLDAQNAILEARRKVLESMKARKKATPVVAPTISIATSEVVTIEVEATQTAMTSPDKPSDAKTIEQEMLDLEQEVMDLRKEAEDAMDLDEPEEGEITPSSLPAPLPAAPTFNLGSTSLPILNRGIKRPNAEDLDEKPVTAQYRPRRKPFGGAPMKPSRLMINLDEQSDSDTDDESGGPTPAIGLDLVMKEKELQIRLLKEKIAARMKAKAAQKARTGSASPASAVNEAIDTPSHAISSLVPVAVKDVNMEAEVDKDCENDFEIIKGKSGDDSNAELAQTLPSTERSVTAAQARPGVRYATTADPIGDDPIAQPLFAEYRSLMRRYPQLTATSQATQSFSQYQLKTSSVKRLSDVFTALDRPLLSSIILTNRLAEDPHIMICPAEAGGGICADPGCEAVHLDKGEPRVQDWVEYIVQVISTSTTVQADRAKATNAVTQAMKAKAKGKGKAVDSGQRGKGEVTTSSLASEHSLSMFLVKIGETYLAQPE